MSTYTYADPLGRNLTIDGEFTAGLRLWQSQFTVTSQLNGRVPDSLLTRTLSVSHPQNHDEWLESTAKASLVGEYSMSGGSLEIWRPSDERNQGLGRWVGEFHAVTAFLPFQQWENHDFVLGYFADVQFRDSAAGLGAVPVKTSITVNVLDVTALIQGTGLLEVLSPEVGMGNVPSWEGRKVPAGEVWKVTDLEDADVVDHLVMSSGTAVATVTPSDGVTFDECLAFLSQIERLDYERTTT